jgi:hypothetical protein
VSRKSIFFWAPDTAQNTHHDWAVLGSLGWVRTSSTTVKGLYCDFCRVRASERNFYRTECLSDADKVTIAQRRRRLSDQSISEINRTGFNAGGSTATWSGEDDPLDEPTDFAMYPRYWEESPSQIGDSSYEVTPDSEESVDEMFDHASDAPDFGEDPEVYW